MISRRSFLRTVSGTLLCAVVPARYLWPYLRAKARQRQEAERLLKERLQAIWESQPPYAIISSKSLVISDWREGVVQAADVFVSDFGSIT